MITKVTMMIPTKARTLKKFYANLKEHPTEIINREKKGNASSKETKKR